MQKLRHVALGAVTAAAAFLPWALQGMRLPLQNLGVADQSEPFSLLPVSQYYIAAILGIFTVGMTLAALSVRLIKDSQRFLFFVGALALQVAAVVQAIAVTMSVLTQDSRTSTYMAIVTALMVICLLYAAATFWLVTAKPPVAVILGVVMAALAFSAWIEFFPSGGWDPLTWLLLVLGWAIPFAAVGFTLGWFWSTMTRTSRWVLVPTTWVLLIVGSSVFSALKQVGGSRASYTEYLSDPGALIPGIAQSTWWALESQPYLLGTLLLGVGLVLGFLAAKRLPVGGAEGPVDKR